MSSKNFYGLTGDVTIDGGILNVANTNVSGNVTSTSLFVSNVATLGTTKTFVVTAGGGLYSIDGNSQASLELHEGQTYIFDITASNAGGHPFKISEAQESGEYSNGVDDSVTNYIKFTVPFGAPTTLYYYCTQHSGMGATISISPAAELVVSGRIVASGNVEASKITASANVEVTGNVVASTFVGDGSLLTGISTVTSSGLQVVTDNSPTTTNTIQFTNPTTSLRASSNIVATGNVTADHFIGDGSRLSGIITSVSLGDAVNTGNITSNTVQFTNTSTSLTASGNVEVAGNVVTSGNVEAAYFIGDGSQLSGIVTSVTLGDAVNTGNITSNTVQFTNTSTSLTASGNVEVVGNVVAAYFVGDGSRLTGISGGGSGTSQWTNTVTTNELYYTAGSVGISNANPIHDLSVGSNLYVDDDATDGILKVTGNVNATYFVGDGSRLINLPAAGGSTDWTTSGNPVNKIYYPQNPGTTSVSVGIMNAAPTHTLSVGSNLFIDDTASNVLVVDGDISAESMFLGALGIKPSYPLDTVTEVGNVTPHTISFTNPTLSITTASNVEIGGALVVGKGTLGGSNLEVGEANLFVNTDLTRVGIGTDQPEATLHVNGDLSVGGVINMGIINVVAQHSLEAVTATGNTTPLTIELQNADTSLVTTGNVEVGGELNVSGNVTVSSNLTVSGNVSDLNVVSNVNMLHTSNTASIKLNSNVVTEFPRSKKLIKYPRVVIASGQSGLSGGYTQDGYTVQASSEWGGIHMTSNVFNGIKNYQDGSPPDSAWLSGGDPDTYTLSTGLATTVDQFQDENGSWVGLALPDKIKLSSVHLYNRRDQINSVRPARKGIVWGSDGGSTWYRIKDFTNGSMDGALNVISVDSNVLYDHFRVQITEIHNSPQKDAVAIGELEFYGVPEYDPDAHGTDVTVKSYPNVPNTDWLEVYYDGQDYTADTDFDQANEVLDKSGNNLHGSQTGGVGFDSTYKAFTFDGTDDYIEGAVTAETGAWSHTIAFWIKIDQIPSSSGMTVFQIKDSSLADNVNAATSTSPHLVIDPGTGYINNAFQGNPGQFLDDNGNRLVAQTGVWQHYVVQYDASNGGTDYRDRKLIINGNKEYYPAGGTTTALSMVASNKLFIGCMANAGLNGPGYFFDGSIANFRIFNRALTSDEIYQLYAYQKEYFGHGDLSMTLKAGRLGIGTSEPRAMLDVRGDIISSGYMFKSGMALGGNATYHLNGYRIHAFTQSGIFYANGINSVNILLVGGGGGGGTDNAGGGGAGGLIFMSNLSVPDGAHNVVVGHGGVGSYSQGNPSGNGGNSTFLHLTALGGGGGAIGNGTASGSSGGSGGGGQGEQNTQLQGYSGTQTTDTTISTDSRTYGYGNNGGSGGSGAGADSSTTQNGGGGGGGAGAVGGNANDSGDPDFGGTGGVGLYYVTVDSVTYDFASIFGLAYGDRYNSSRTYFAGGGAGGNSNADTTDIGGGLGGGGHSLGSNIDGGSKWRHSSPMNGLDNTGGGGAGGTYIGPDVKGGNGGSGITLIMYQI